jgi:hypothetical protein
MAQKTDKQLLQHWKEYSAGIRNSTPIDTTEKTSAKISRIKRLEADPEEWFKYYFPKYASAPPAAFHKAATRRVLGNPEWYEVRNWSRELAKSTRTMMEVLFLTLTGKKKNVLIISNSYDNAERLLLPYMVNLEANNRIINDYGDQENIGTWTNGEFITKKGAAFRAIGAGQSPRGTRNEAARPDVILFDDLDTDEDCRNIDIIDQHWNWVQEAVIPTRSVSNPLLVIWCGNVIAEDCCVVRAREFADKVEQVNIRDGNGKSTWPEKNSEADIDRVLSLISYASQQKEYFNNPMSTGKTFTEIRWDKCPPLKDMRFAVCYADPAPSNKDRPGQKSNLNNSRKAVFIVARRGDKNYIYTGFLDVMGTRIFIASMYACRSYIANACPSYFYIENNTLQDPFYEQVLLPEVFGQGRENNGVLGILPDTRKKPEKWPRIEATLEPLNRMGNLIFNIEEKNNPHMQRLEAQFKSAKATSKELDGPDAIEGAIWIINQKATTYTDNNVQFQHRSRNPSKNY